MKRSDDNEDLVEQVLRDTAERDSDFGFVGRGPGRGRHARRQRSRPRSRDWQGQPFPSKTERAVQVRNDRWDATFVEILKAAGKPLSRRELVDAAMAREPKRTVGDEMQRLRMAEYLSNLEARSILQREGRMWCLAQMDENASS